MWKLALTVAAEAAAVGLACWACYKAGEKGSYQSGYEDGVRHGQIIGSIDVMTKTLKILSDAPEKEEKTEAD